MNAAGLFTGVLALAALEVVTSSPRAANGLGDAGLMLSGLANRIVSPEVALIPNLHDSNGPHASSPADAAATKAAVQTQIGILTHPTKASQKIPTGRSPVVAPPPSFVTGGIGDLLGVGAK